MKKNKTFIPILSILLICWITGTESTEAGQLNLGFKYNGVYTDNLFMNASNEPDYISELQSDLNFTLKRFNFYLTTSADIYMENPGYNSFYIEPGLEILHPLKGRNTLYLGIGFRLLKYKDIYTDFNYSGPLLQGGIKLYTSLQTLLKAGIRFQLRKYSDYESFDFIENTLFIEFKYLLKTQTTLRLRSGFNYRHYPHIWDDYEFGDDYNYFQNHASHGKGKGNPGNQSGHNTHTNTYHTLNIPGIHGLLGIDQSITTRIGISGEIEFRELFQGLEYDNAETLIKNAYILYPLNDDYLWKGIRLSMKLNMVLFNRQGLTLEGNVSYLNKHYSGIYVLDAEGNPITPLKERKDTLTFYVLRVSKSIGKFELFTEFNYRDNKSNDNYFLYDLLTISGGISYYL